MTSQIIHSFPHIPANKNSASSRTPLYGVGVNDATYTVRPTIDNKTIICPFYRSWMNMLSRCYCKKYHQRQPTYIGCTVCPEWLYFSNFRRWMVKQNWKGNELDKDLILTGNKVYSPSTCIFVPKEINRLLVSSNSTNGTHPKGVTYESERGKYKAQISIEGKQTFIGRYHSPKEAESAYNAAKYKTVMKHAFQQPNPLRSILLSNARRLL